MLYKLFMVNLDLRPLEKVFGAILVHFYLFLEPGGAFFKAGALLAGS